ncbi:phage tail tape measure protein [Zobellella denitrificans]|uniref:phage tail tape measure protein n=1 Tax=Zobellella denitrificans TaxID=347534 RepID=UPI000B8C11D4|nr:phage tail tape measure protein [Zobellella denitrificans]OXS13999.1 phage tail tape measure protein [Zobellella denitrificans]
MKHLEQLMLTVGLVDQVTKPIQGINQQIERTGQIGRQSWQNIAGGAAGLLASGVALHQALMPAIEMDRVLGEVKSLGVLQEDLDQLNRTATDFAIEFGKSATGFVGAAYDIKSAMGDLSGKELAGITKASAVLAAATKADTATITSYMGTMYGSFKQQADAMGRDNFAAMVAGQTAQAVEMFKTTGAEMASAFGRLGANATSQGASMAEQIAILGTLQSTMSGSEAATKYNAFINGIAKAQGDLGIQMTDSNGRMLDMVTILQKLKDKFGDTMTVAESDALKKAFGSNEAVSLIKLLMTDIDGLGASINGVGQQTGMDKATEMAGAMTDQWERLGAAWEALRRGAGQSVLGTINDLVSVIVDQMAVLTEWTYMFPHLTEVVTWVAVGLAGLTALAASWTLIMGISSGMMVFFKGGLLGIVWVLKMLRIGFILTRTAMLAWAAIKMTLVAGTWLLSAAFTALGAVMSFVFSPFFLIAAALVALALGAVWLARNWDAVKATLMEIPFVQVLVGAFEAIAAGWRTFLDVLGNLSPLDLLGRAFDWLIEKINLIPGVNIKTSSERTASETINAALADVRRPESLAAADTAQPIMPQVARAAASSGGKTVHFGDVHIKSDGGMNPDDLAEWEELQSAY